MDGIIFSIFVPLIVSGLWLGFLWLGLRWVEMADKKHLHHSPLSKKRLRLPGTFLRDQLWELNLDYVLRLVLLGVAPFLILLIHIGQSYFFSQPETVLRFSISILLFLAAEVALFVSLRKLSERRRTIRLGLDAEMYVGEYLNELMLQGCRVFHDVPVPNGGNIDHIVISETGVFAVETKSVGQLRGKSTSKDAYVDAKKGTVKFPDRTYRIGLKQMKAQRDWLEKKLKDSVGEAFVVESILALPGWHVKGDLIGKQFCVVNPKNAKGFFTNRLKRNSPKQVSLIAHQIRLLCTTEGPDVRDEPEGFGQE